MVNNTIVYGISIRTKAAAGNSLLCGWKFEPVTYKIPEHSSRFRRNSGTFYEILKAHLLATDSCELIMDE